MPTLPSDVFLAGLQPHVVLVHLRSGMRALPRSVSSVCYLNGTYIHGDRPPLRYPRILGLPFGAYSPQEATT